MRNGCSNKYIKKEGGDNMKKILMSLFLSVIATFLIAGSVNATLLGLDLQTPDIFSDTTGTYSYNSSTDLLTFDATALTITFDDVTLITITGGDYNADFYVDSTGNLSGGVPGNDLTITGSFTDPNSNVVITGTLLTGEVTNFGWEDGTYD